VHSLDGIIDTVSAKHEISQLLPLLDVDGTLVLLGVPPEPHTFGANSVLFSRRGSGRHWHFKQVPPAAYRAPPPIHSCRTGCGLSHEARKRKR